MKKTSYGMLSILNDINDEVDEELDECAVSSL
jgi:hypothetical protein